MMLGALLLQGYGPCGTRLVFWLQADGRTVVALYVVSSSPLWAEEPFMTL